MWGGESHMWKKRASSLIINEARRYVLNNKVNQADRLFCYDWTHEENTNLKQTKN